MCILNLWLTFSYLGLGGHSHSGHFFWLWVTYNRVGPHATTSLMIDFQYTPLHVDLLGSECIISLLSYSACFGSLMAFWTSLSDALWADTTEVSMQCEKRRKERLMTLLSFGASGHGRSLSREDTAGNRMMTPKASHANGNVLHHSAINCTLISSRSSQCCSDVNDTS